MTRTITAQEAVWRGMLTVNGTVVLMMFAPPLVVGAIVAMLGFKDLGVMIGLVLVIPSWICAWLSWSILTPRWRVWAYARVDDLDDLKAQAVTAGLLWPEGHFFQRTEIRPPALRSKIAELEEGHRNRRPADLSRR